MCPMYVYGLQEGLDKADLKKKRDSREAPGEKKGQAVWVWGLGPWRVARGGHCQRGAWRVARASCACACCWLMAAGGWRLTEEAELGDVDVVYYIGYRRFGFRSARAARAQRAPCGGTSAPYAGVYIPSGGHFACGGARRYAEPPAAGRWVSG
jgi:hypothetical protein